MIAERIIHVCFLLIVTESQQHCCQMLACAMRPFSTRTFAMGIDDITKGVCLYLDTVG